MSEVLVRVLGPVEIECDGVVRMMRGRTRRRVLASLAANRRSVVSIEQLAEVTGNPAAAVRTTVCRLRKDVGVGVILTNSLGYSIDPDHCDATVVEQLLAEAKRSDPAHALRCLDVALAYRRGRCFGQLADEDWARAEAIRLEELLAAAEEDRADLLIEIGRNEEAVAALRAHVEDYPLRDRPQRSLMVALDRAGRTTEALRQFQAYRGRLADFGVEPPVATVALERRIATGQPAPPAGAVSAT